MLQAIAIDDEPSALTIIKSHAAKVSFLHLAATFTNPFQGIEYINDRAPDIVFLDINMPDISGLQLLKNLTKKPLIIFTTAHSEYAVKSYEVEAVDYLLKPFRFDRFLKAVSHVAASNAESKRADHTIRPFCFFMTINKHEPYPRIRLGADAGLCLGIKQVDTARLKAEPDHLAF